MTTGTLVTVNSKGTVIKRDPIWPFPPRSEYPRTNADSTVTHFIPKPYYTVKIGDHFHETHH